MGYYDEIIEKLDKAFSKEDYDFCKKIIEEELNMPYVPKDLQEKLLEYKNRLPFDDKTVSISDDKIMSYLKGSQEQQLLAVNWLNDKNLRDYIDICNEYLSSDGFKNAKVLLIDSLISQEIGEDIKYIDNGLEYNFIPKFTESPKDSEGFKTAYKILEDKYLKEPSLFEMSKSLLYKECLMSLPLVPDSEEEGQQLAANIIDYINKAFN